MKHIFLFILIAFYSTTSLAQDGYILNFETENLQGKTIEISHYYGSSKIYYSKKIVAISENKQSVLIRDTSIIEGGIYKVNFIGQKESKDIVIDNGDSLSFGIDTISIKNLYSINSPKNKLFFLYPSIDNDSIINTYKKKYPKSVGALYFELENKRKNIPPYNPKNITYQTEFWNTIDLSNPQLRYMPNIYQTLNMYNSIQPISDSTYSFSMNKVLERVEPGSANFEFFLTWYFKNMRYHEQYFLDKIFVKTYNKYFDTLKLKFNNISNLRAIENNYDDVKANMKGEVIKDFSFFNENDSTIILSKIYQKNDYTFIAFYDPYCYHCQKAMPKISAFFTEIKAEKKQKIETIGMLNSYSQDGWKAFIKKNKMQNWINLYSQDENKKYQEDFNTYSNPRFFLLNQKGELISRSGNPKELFRIINQK